MKSAPRTHVYPLIKILLLLPGALLLLPLHARAECKEFRIVEYEDRVEAVCVGEPLTDAQKKANQEEEKRLELETRRQKTEEQNRQREADLAVKAQAEAERKKQAIKPVAPQAPVNRNTTTNPQILIK